MTPSLLKTTEASSGLLVLGGLKERRGHPLRSCPVSNVRRLYQGFTCHTCGYDSRTTIGNTSRSKKPESKDCSYHLPKMVASGGVVCSQSRRVMEGKHGEWLLRWHAVRYTYLAEIRLVTVREIPALGVSNQTATSRIPALAVSGVATLAKHCPHVRADLKGSTC